MNNDAPAVVSAPAPGRGSQQRVIIHIGSTKTGSSALQATLFQRREELAAAGGHYSAHGVAAGAHHLLAASIHPGAWRMHRAELPQEQADYFAPTAAAIREEAAAAGAHTLILSTEYWWGSFPPAMYKAIREAFGPAAFEIVAFVRRQDEWAMSSYLQAVKSGETRDFAEWAQKAVMRPGSGLNYFRVINRWAYFLDAKVHVLRYQDTKDNVYAAFCRTVGLKVDTDVAPARVNPSPTAEGVAALLTINRSDLPEAEKAAARSRAMQEHRAAGPLAMLLSREERDSLLKAFAQSDALIASRFLHREPPLFDPERPAPAQEALATTSAP